VDLCDGVLTIWDKKGRRPEAREHVIPLTEPTLAIVKRLMDSNAKNEFLFTKRNGHVLSDEAVSRLVNGISARLFEASRVRQPFQLRDIRRTCETRMADIGIHKDDRAQILSHGIGGIQSRYDMYDYLRETRKELNKWVQRPKELRAGLHDRPNVVELKRA
jgi:integrase